MAIDDWVFPKLEANLGAWRRFWVQQVVLPNFGRDIVHDTPLAGYAQYLSTSSVKRMMLDTISRAEAKSEKRALKALQNGADVRDLPGSDVAIASLRQVYQEIQHWTTTEFVEGNFYHLMERLSTAVMSYTYCPNLEPRLCDRLIGPQGRQFADSVSRAWMSYPVFQFLNQPFHPAAQHFRVDYLDAQTAKPEDSPDSVTRPSGGLPRSAAAHGGTNPHTCPYFISYIGPMPPIAGVPDEDGNFTLVETACSLNLFDTDWPGSPEEAQHPALLWESVPQVPYQRAYQVDSVQAWVDLVTRYPLEFTNDLVREEFARLTGKRAVFLGVDWERVRQDYDVVHFGFEAVLDCADVAVGVSVPEGWVPAGSEVCAVMYRVVPASTVWLQF